MKISACYITKNEERNLPESLAGVKKIVDEIIVVDTGSTDKTCQIAKEYGAKIYSYTWKNDFSGPRNYALDQAMGDWIIFLDADEILQHSDKKRLVNWLKSNDEQLLFMMWMKHVDLDTQQILLENMAPRLLRNSSELRYEGRIHEQLCFAGKPVETVGFCPMNIGWLLHTGYTQSKMKAKAERNLSILLDELKAGTPSSNIDMYLAEAYDGINDWEKATSYAMKDIAKGRRPVIYASRSWTLLLRLYANRPEYVQERLQVALSAVANFPELPLFHAELAECYAAAANYDGAVHSYENALQAYEKYQQGAEPQSLTAAQVDQIKRRMSELKKKIHYPKQWAMAHREAIPELHQENETAVMQIMPELIQHIIRIQREEPSADRDELLIHLISYLPADYEMFWQYQLGVSDVAPANAADIYLAVLPYILQYGNEEQRKYYSKQSLLITTDCFYKTVELLLDREEWLLAWTLLEQITADSDWIRPEYWYDVGVCLFYQNENAAALECFSRAKDEGIQDENLETYIQWTKEGG